MTVEQVDVIDFIGIDEENHCILTISDHLEWDDEHLLILQNKINRYLAFLESGEVYETYPSAKDKQILIRIACKYQPTEKGDWFLQQCKEIIKNAGFKFEYLVHSE